MEPIEARKDRSESPEQGARRGISRPRRGRGTMKKNGGSVEQSPEPPKREGVADITFGLQTYTPALFPKSILIVPPGKHTTSLQSTEAIWNVFDKYFADDLHLPEVCDYWVESEDEQREENELPV